MGKELGRGGKIIRFLRGRGSQPTVTEEPPLSLLPDVRISTELERHQAIIASEVLKTLDRVDAKVTEKIGFSWRHQH